MHATKTLYRQSYGRGIPITPLEQTGTVSWRGTKIIFKPDYQIFGQSAHFKPNKLYKIIRSKAYLFKGVKIIWKCSPDLIKDDTPLSDILHFPNGLRDFLSLRTKNMPTITVDMFAGEADFSDTIGKTEWAVTWTHEDSFLSSYCNTIPTPLGGTHEQGLRNALTKGLKNYATLRNHKKLSVITPEDVMAGVIWRAFYFYS